MAQKDKMTAYRICRPILGFIYKLYYNPTIIGKENIPEDGSIVVVGNHVHIMDQCNIIIVTKRCLHYMAKKEYFDGKFAWFFKATGCIPVDRSKKDEHATHDALEVLHDGHALGLFPEGTRNGLKEEKAKELYEKYIKEDISFEDFYKRVKKNKTSQANYLEELINTKTITKKEFIENIYDMDSFLRKLVRNKKIKEKDYYENILLPFKYGAVSMAKKTNSKLVPFAITGDYKFRSKNLTIRIGKPIDPEEDLESANKKLRKEMLKLIKENHKNSGK